MFVPLSKPLHYKQYMRKIFVMFFFILSLYSFGQKRILNRVHPGDTVKISVERMGDCFGPYAGDTLLLVVKASGNFIHSSKRGKWYTVNPQAYKLLVAMEKQGSGKKYAGQRVDLYTLKSQNNVSAFSLAPHYFDDFMVQLKSGSADSQTHL
jgi:hypothetical protein